MDVYTKEVKVYVCSICKCSYSTEYAAEHCEEKCNKLKKQANCNHNYTYDVEVDIDFDSESVILIRECKSDCGVKHRLTFLLYDLPESFIKAKFDEMDKDNQVFG